MTTALFQRGRMTEQAPAKLNLFFEVYGKRPDGFHDIASVALPVCLFDTITLESNDGGDIQFECHGGTEDIPCDDSNIVVKTLRLFLQQLQHDGELSAQEMSELGLRVQLVKKIPSQAGLGGGSSDAVAALRGTRRLWSSFFQRRRLSEERIDAMISKIAAQIGSDCSLFLCPSASLSRGRGESVQPVSAPPLYFVVYKPPQGLSTAAVYAQCMALHDRQFRHPDDLLNALASRDLPQIAQHCFNRLENSAQKIWPEFESVQRELTRLDCLTVQMSGSGTAFFGLCENQAHAEKAAEQLRLRCGTEEAVFAVASLGK